MPPSPPDLYKLSAHLEYSSDKAAFPGVHLPIPRSWGRDEAAPRFWLDRPALEMIKFFMTSRFLSASLIAVLGWATGSPCAAADAPTTPPPRATTANPAKDDAWIVTLQGIGAVAPSFPGSLVVRPYPFPGVSVRAVGEAESFSTPDDGFGIPVFELGWSASRPRRQFRISARRARRLVRRAPCRPDS